MATSILGSKNKAGGISTPDFKLHCKVVEIKMTQCWNRNSSVGQGDGAEDSETSQIDSAIVSLTKGPKASMEQNTCSASSAGKT